MSLRHADMSFALLLSDFVAAGVGVMAGAGIWIAFDREFIGPARGDGVIEIAAAAVAWTSLLRLFGGAELAAPRFGRRSVDAIGQALVTMTALVLVIFFFTPFFAPRGATLLGLPTTAITLLAWREAYRRLVASHRFDRRIAIFGIDEAARRANTAIAVARSGLQHAVIAFLAPEPSCDMLDGLPVAQVDADTLWPVIQRLDIDQIVIGRSRSLPAPLFASLAMCFERGIEAVPATALYETLSGRVMVAELEADWYGELPTHVNSVYTTLKRLAEVALVLLTAPVTLTLFGLTAAAVFLDSGRPILIRQLRVGQRGETFVLHKFRSMRRDAEPNGSPVWASENDPRVTRIGRFIRRIRLDELPQLWDILRGKMSLVGPRPERPEFVAQLSQELPLYRARALVRPGLTGWAQVQYAYAGSVESNLTKLEYDLYYIRHLGIALDVGILLRTVRVIFGFKGR